MDDVALSISSTNMAWGMGGAKEGSLQKTSAHIMLIISLRGTMVNRLEMLMSTSRHLFLPTSGLTWFVQM